MMRLFSLSLSSDFCLDDGLENAIAKGFPHGIYKLIALLNHQTRDFVS
jgi:hypothetical protein